MKRFSHRYPTLRNCLNSFEQDAIQLLNIDLRKEKGSEIVTSPWMLYIGYEVEDRKIP